VVSTKRKLARLERVINFKTAKTLVAQMVIGRRCPSPDDSLTRRDTSEVRLEPVPHKAAARGVEDEGVKPLPAFE